MRRISPTIRAQELLSGSKGWSAFENSDDGSKSALENMSPDSHVQGADEIDWPHDVEFQISANDEIWGSVPYGISPVHMSAVFVSDSKEGKAEKTRVVGDSSVTHLIFDQNNQIVGEMYLSINVDEEDAVGTKEYTLVFSTDEGLCGVATYHVVNEAFEQKSLEIIPPVVSRIVVNLIHSDAFILSRSIATIDDGGHNLIRNAAMGIEGNTEPLKNLDGWNIGLPYDSDAADLLLLSSFYGIGDEGYSIRPEDAQSTVMISPDGLLDLHGQSCRFFAIPPADDERIQQGSPLFVIVQSAGSVVVNSYKNDPGEVSDKLTSANEEITVSHHLSVDEAEINGDEGVIIAQSYLRQYLAHFESSDIVVVGTSFGHEPLDYGLEFLEICRQISYGISQDREKS